MKTILKIIMLLFVVNSFSQNSSKKRQTDKSNYSEKSELKVFYSENLKKFHSNQKPAGVFVNNKFIGNQEKLESISLMNPEKIESLNIEKENFKINETEYYGKILITMKSDYNPKFVTLKELSKKYLTLNENPIIYQIDDRVINNRKDKILVDENFILKIIVNKVKTSEKEIEINLVRLITKTPENIKKANEIRIKGISK